MRTHSRRMREREEHVVVHLHAGSAAIQFGVHIGDGTEQVQRLVDEMSAEIVEQPARQLRLAALAPSALRLRTPAFEPRLEAQYVAERLFRQQPLDGEQLTVPATVVIDGQKKISTSCLCN